MTWTSGPRLVRATARVPADTLRSTSGRANWAAPPSWVAYAHPPTLPARTIGRYAAHVESAAFRARARVRGRTVSGIAPSLRSSSAGVRCSAKTTSGWFGGGGAGIRCRTIARYAPLDRPTGTSGSEGAAWLRLRFGGLGGKCERGDRVGDGGRLGLPQQGALVRQRYPAVERAAPFQGVREVGECVAQGRPSREGGRVLVEVAAETAPVAAGVTGEEQAVGGLPTDAKGDEQPVVMPVRGKLVVVALLALLVEGFVVRDVRADAAQERGALDDVGDAGQRAVMCQHGRPRLEFHTVVAAQRGHQVGVEPDPERALGSPDVRRCRRMAATGRG